MGDHADWRALKAEHCPALNTRMRFYEFSPQKPLSPEQAKIRTLQDQAKRAQVAVKAERARQRMRSAQASLNQVESVFQIKGPYRAQYKQSNAYIAWITVGSYGNFNDALNAVLRKKKTGSLAVRIEDANKVVVYSS